MTIRLLQIIPTLDRGGAEKQLTLLSTGLPSDEFEVHVCALTRGGPLADTLAEHNIPVTVIGKSWKLDPFAYRRLKSHIRRLAPDIVHTWIFAANAYGRAAALSAGVRHVVAGERCIDLWKASHQFLIDRYLARRSAGIAVPSQGVADFYASRGISQDLFTVIPNGIDATVASDDFSREALLDELGLPANVRLIGAVGRLWPQKRYKDAIWVADLLKCIRDDVHLLIIGDGPQRWRLERFRDQVRIRDRVHFLGHRNDVPRLMPHFDCLWLTSGYEGLPNCVMEAMVAGVPVIGTNISGTRDLVVHGETGFLVPVGDRAALTEHTLRILDDETLAETLGAAARQRIEEHFSVKQMVNRYVDMYRSVGERGDT